ncbi:MAG: beta-ketoacyl synthase chain length factor [Pseudomonadales bacterium]|jgi:hypothetical protein|nr:beta-ketoacyl synthase chain length factor [Pseudomonadales bacterium]
MFTFAIEGWRAWAAGIHDELEWREWAQAPFCPSMAEDSVPPLAFLPAMQRRRLNMMARMVFDCAWPLAQGRSAMPLVYASRYGETARDFELLLALARGEPLSPTSFGLSVHNAVAGQWSIIRHEMTESVAISAEGDGLEHAFLEAGMLLAQGRDEVLVVAVEERPPLAYCPWVDDVPFSHALAVRLKAGTACSLSLAPGGEAAAAPLLPGALQWLRHLLSGASSWRHQAAGREWTWALNP